jgi:hypothetical protein
MKTFEELLNTQEPGWAVVQGWLRKATNPVEVLPPVEEKRKAALVAIQVTTRSPMGAIIYETGGILADHGWIRILAIAGAMSGRSKHTEPGGKRGDCQGCGGLTATLEGNSVKISAAKDAKAGSHQVTVRDAEGK